MCLRWRESSVRILGITKGGSDDGMFYFQSSVLFLRKCSGKLGGIRSRKKGVRNHNKHRTPSRKGSDHRSKIIEGRGYEFRHK